MEPTDRKAEKALYHVVETQQPYSMAGPSEKAPRFPSPTPPFSKRFVLIESLRLLTLSLSKGAY